MTRRGDNPSRGKPDSMALAELAIAAGMAGESLSLCFCDYAAPVLCALWKDLTGSLDRDAVLWIDGRPTLRKLENNLDRFRLVIVHKPSLYLETNWMIQMQAGPEETPLPAVFATAAPADLDNDPAPTLVLRGSVLEGTALTSWLSDGERRRVDWAAIQEWLARDNSESHANEIVEHAHELQQRISSLRDLQIVRGLTAGECLLRLARNSERPSLPLPTNRADYERVRSRLMSQVISSAERPLDELALAMVKRANEYLAIKTEVDEVALNPLADDQRDFVPTSGVGSNREPISRREIVDLGDTGAGMVRRLIEYLQRLPDGYGRYIEMGLVGRPPRPDSWARQSAPSLATRLRSWSPKQVRTIFVRLQHEGLITAVRCRANGAWHYQIPESIATASNRFADLPQVP